MSCLPPLMPHDEKFPQVRVVNASAGSGKTYALAKRYVQLLLQLAARQPQSLKYILAITFTNKATSQMKTRIIFLLKSLALGVLPEKQEEEVLKPLALNIKEGRRLANSLIEEIIRHYHFFNVQTIDSFMNTLLSGCAFKMNLSARFKIKRNPNEYLLLSLDELIASAQKNPEIKRLFEDYVRQYLFLENRSNWFPKKDLIEVCVALFGLYHTYQKDFIGFNQDSSAVITYKKQFIETAARIQELLPESADKRFKSGLDDFLLSHPHGFDIDHVSRYFGREEIPIKKGGEVSDELLSLWEQARKLLNLICLLESYAVFNPYVNVFREVMKNFDQIQTHEDILFVPQLNKKAGDLFGQGLVTVEELYYRLATRFKHYLIDEFQDTSQSQWDNLKALVGEGLASGGSLFYVGDKKQAIYGFRGGASYLFDDIKTALNSYPIIEEQLDTNWRSHRHIVAFNNHVFNMENLNSFLNKMQEQDSLKDNDIAFNPDDRQALCDVFNQSHQQHLASLNNGYVEVEMVMGKRKEERLEIIRNKVITIIKEAKERFELKDIALLARNNEEVLLLTGWLLAEGIYVQSERTSDIKNHPLVLELIAFLEFLHSPIDNTAFTNFLLGDIYTKAVGWTPEQSQAFLFDARIQIGRSNTFFYQVFKEKHAQIWDEYFKDFFTQVGITPLYELAINIMTRFKCLTLFPEAQGFIMHFLELIKRQEQEGCDLESFLEYFENIEDQDRFVPMPVQQAVQVLTIHKAKGLEFEVVMIPFLEMSVKVGSGKGDGGRSFLCEHSDEGMRLLRLKEKYGLFCPSLKERYVAEYKKSLASELNSIYVALTRAKREMYVLIPERAGIAFNPAILLIPESHFKQGEKHRATKQATKVEVREYLPPVKTVNWINRMQEEFLYEEVKNTLVRKQGELIHFLLASIENLSDLNVDNVIAQAITKAKEVYLHIDNWSAYEDFLRKHLKQESWRKFFYLSKEAQVLCEQEIVTRSVQVKRLDRLIIFPKEVWVVDFKSSQAPESFHQEQLDEYCQLLKQLYPNRKIEGFICPYEF